jgi:hypothetical protein
MSGRCGAVTHRAAANGQNGGHLRSPRTPNNSTQNDRRRENGKPAAFVIRARYETFYLLSRTHILPTIDFTGKSVARYDRIPKHDTMNDLQFPLEEFPHEA